MNKEISAKDKLIFSVLFLLDRWAEMHDYFKNPRAIEPYRLHSDVAGWYLRQINKEPVNKTALCRLRNKDGISFDKSDFSLLIEPQSFKKTYYWKKFKLVLEDKEWDGWWRVVVFDIPEKNRSLRAKVRYHLKKIGFVYWQKSVWVTIFDIDEELKKVIRQFGLEDYVLILKSKNVGPLDNDRLIKRFFSPVKVSRGYEDFIERTAKALKEKDYFLLKKSNKEFVDLVYQDSGVPGDFLSKKGLRKEAASLFRRSLMATLAWESKEKQP